MIMLDFAPTSEPWWGGLGTKTPPGVCWGQWFHAFFFITFSHYGVTLLSLGSWESLYVSFEACIHASEGAQVPHDHVGLIEILFSSK
jgi:hypothetical protein